LDQNRWLLSTRISGHFESESLAGLDQNMHKAKEKDEKDYKSIRDAFIKYPSDPVVRRDYLLARRKRRL